MRMHSLRTENKIFIMIIVTTAFIYFFFMLFYGQIFFNFLTEFTAGVLGILIGFSLDRYIELWKKVRVSRQIVNQILVELNDNLELVSDFKVRWEREHYFFGLFQTSIWNMLSSRLEIDDIEILFELGSLYHRFELLNEAIRLEAVGGQLSTHLKEKPKFLDELEKDLDTVIETLNHLRI